MVRMLVSSIAIIFTSYVYHFGKGEFTKEIRCGKKKKLLLTGYLSMLKPSNTLKNSIEFFAFRFFISLSTSLARVHLKCKYDFLKSFTSMLQQSYIKRINEKKNGEACHFRPNILIEHFCVYWMYFEKFQVHTWSISMWPSLYPLASCPQKFTVRSQPKWFGLHVLQMDLGENRFCRLDVHWKSNKITQRSFVCWIFQFRFGVVVEEFFVSSLQQAQMTATMLIHYHNCVILNLDWWNGTKAIP